MRREAATLEEPVREWYVKRSGGMGTVHSSFRCATSRLASYDRISATVRAISWRGTFCRRCTLGIPEIAILGERGEI